MKNTAFKFAIGAGLALIIFLVTGHLPINSAAVVGAKPQSAATRQIDLSHDLRHILDLTSANDLKGLEAQIPYIRSRWGHPPTDEYFHLIYTLCQALDSMRDGDAPDLLAEKLVEEALTQGGVMTEYTEISLLRSLAADIQVLRGKVKGLAYDAYRGKRSRLWLHAIQRIDAGIDTTMDMNDMPQRFHAQEFGDLNDPKQLLKFKQARERESRKALRRGRQIDLREDKKEFFPEAERYLVHVYSAPPYNLPQLKEYLDLYLTDKEMKRRIMEKVQWNMESAHPTIVKPHGPAYQAQVQREARVRLERLNAVLQFTDLQNQELQPILEHYIKQQTAVAMDPALSEETRRTRISQIMQSLVEQMAPLLTPEQLQKQRAMGIPHTPAPKPQ